jgi:hypothetical protein
MVLGEPRSPCLGVYGTFFSTFGRAPWAGGIARPMPTQDSTTQKDEANQPHLERDSNPRSCNKEVKTHASDRGATVFSNHI